MESLCLTFKRDVHRWRTGASIGWTIITLPILFSLYISLVNFDIFHPLQWISGSFASYLSAYFLLLCCLVTIVTALWCFLSVGTYSVEPEVHSTLLRLIVQFFTLQKLVFACVCVFCSVMISLLSSGVLSDRYHELTFCTPSSQCFLNEYHLFMVLYGSYIGVAFFFCHYLQQNNYLQFSILQQSKYFQVRSNVFPVLKRCVHNVFWQTIYFYPIFWLLGNIPIGWLTHSLSLRRNDLPLDTLYGLCDIRLFYQSFIVGLFVNVSWSVSSLLLKVYITERYYFPIESLFENQKNQCLIDALCCEQDPLIKYLGFLDLCQLSKHSPERRCTVFSLSQPGGHPHNWSKLSSACLLTINTLNSKVQDSNWEVLSKAPIRTNITEDKNTGSSITYRGDAVTKEASDSTQKPTQISSFWKTKPILNHLLTEYPESRSRKLFSSAQVDIWAVEALSNLVSASYTEDKYGVVQKSLPQIISSIINLHENVEKHLKLASSSKRTNGTPKDVALKFVLYSTLKSCIYKIINVFGAHLLNLDMSHETKYKLKLFMDYKE